MARHGSDRAAYWRGVVEAWRRSGVSVAAFCRRRDLAEPTFYVWRRRLEDAQGTRPGTPAFVRVPVRVVSSPAAPAGRTSVELTLRGGRVLRIQADFTPQSLAELAAAVEGLPC